MQSQHVASDVVQSFADSRGAAWLTVAMAISALGALHVVVLTGARIPYAMARRWRLLPIRQARSHRLFTTPSGALIFLGSLAALLALSGTYEELYSLFVFGAWIFFALTAIALFRLRRKEPNLSAVPRWGHPWTTLIFWLPAVALTVNLWMVRPVRSSLGLAVILGGVPFFYHAQAASRLRRS